MFVSSKAPYLDLIFTSKVTEENDMTKQAIYCVKVCHCYKNNSRPTKSTHCLMLRSFFRFGSEITHVVVQSIRQRSGHSQCSVWFCKVFTKKRKLIWSNSGESRWEIDDDQISFHQWMNCVLPVEQYAPPLSKR